MMMIHCGGRQVTFDELANIPLPEETDTYKPVAFGDLIANTLNISQGLLKDYDYIGSELAVAGNDQRMFGVIKFKSEESDEMGLAIGIRSSYDKSISNGFCMGANVFVCDNLAFNGTVTYMRKHTKNVVDDLEEKLVSTIWNSQNKFQNILRDKEYMANLYINNDQAYKFLGLMMGHKVLKPRQVAKALMQWKNPPDAFGNRDMWSLYNACTEALKSTPPNRILESHIKLHEFATA
jgi:hypothetical protein|tara:strand:- start:1 stop:708 length:708 start_codon:yes stop_codon:yes gene_type:complete